MRSLFPGPDDAEPTGVAHFHPSSERLATNRWQVSDRAVEASFHSVEPPQRLEAECPPTCIVVADAEGNNLHLTSLLWCWCHRIVQLLVGVEFQLTQNAEPLVSYFRSQRLFRTTMRGRWSMVIV